MGQDWLQGSQNGKQLEALVKPLHILLILLVLPPRRHLYDLYSMKQQRTYEMQKLEPEARAQPSPSFQLIALLFLLSKDNCEVESSFSLF